MTISYNEDPDVRARVRRRRRKLAGTKKLPRRIHRTLVIAGICLIMVFGGYFGTRGDVKTIYGAYAAEETIYKHVTVYSGDTLWDIASEYTEPSKDIRKQVKAICDLNDVSPGKIYPGQVLLVPVPAHLI